MARYGFYITTSLAQRERCGGDQRRCSYLARFLHSSQVPSRIRKAQRCFMLTCVVSCSASSVTWRGNLAQPPTTRWAKREVSRHVAKKLKKRHKNLCLDLQQTDLKKIFQRMNCPKKPLLTSVHQRGCSPLFGFKQGGHPKLFCAVPYFLLSHGSKNFVVQSTL